eukprot:1161309-Pelagomonas_calceolata.AAC.8
MEQQACMLPSATSIRLQAGGGVMVGLNCLGTSMELANPTCEPWCTFPNVHQYRRSKAPTPAPKSVGMSDTSSDSRDSSIGDSGCSSSDEQESARKKQAS